MEHQTENFSYSYCAQQQEEIQNIRKKYLPAQEDKLEILRRLDESATHGASVAALSVGILGALIMGTGMSCAMVWQGIWFFPGIVIGLLGIGLLSMAYPIYRRTLKIKREKIAPQILRLSEELLK
ncbi:MAG: hypothetical protein J6J43_03880 [Oscillospiraceae bacterium]|nr:hypothetical protein [Oscillospiraceae bacterium]